MLQYDDSDFTPEKHLVLKNFSEMTVFIISQMIFFVVLLFLLSFLFFKQKIVPTCEEGVTDLNLPLCLYKLSQ